MFLKKVRESSKKYPYYAINLISLRNVCWRNEKNHNSIKKIFSKAILSWEIHAMILFYGGRITIAIKVIIITMMMMMAGEEL